ncbi:MAG: OsmC family protein [Alphaproteobacteria bacterium]|nr:OsmC family protein [Alphaproteobacteria bacterium]MCZ6591571.1 OsmC family protein [Alphaproteobacteria bacterium]MCZ6838851.1 OsmC family protein [Alphaproteobacteria bacterium]
MSALKDAVETMQNELRANPDKAVATFVADSRQVQGLQSETKIRNFTITVDEPESLGGTDTGPNPVELILGALASCQEITYRAFAEALEIPLDNVSVRIEGDLDLRGFFAVNDNVRAGFQDIRGVVELDSSASEEELAQLRKIVDAHCPVLDILRKPVPVSLEVNHQSRTETNVTAQTFSHAL